MSTLVVNSLKNSQGNIVRDNGYSIQPGQVIECICGPCDGSAVVGKSGTYNLQNVSTDQGTSDSYQVLNGSVLNYLPPAGTSRVIYEFDFHESSHSGGDARSIVHYRFYVGGNEVIHARHTREEDQAQDFVCNFKWTIPIGGSDDNNTGRLSVWEVPKTLELRYRRYNSSYDARFHFTEWFDGSGTGVFHMPTISIKAIG